LHLALYLAFKAHQTRFATERLAPVVVAHETELSSTTLALIFHAGDLIEAPRSATLLFMKRLSLRRLAIGQRLNPPGSDRVPQISI
jgi:hypothetical protein